ncbi:DUF4376 domain-containing protein [Acinetobacter pittii]|uniref:DUF4376 domain-containing protein n=1 Tax=Acinetobacter TaxID=469 RepID=UPI00102376E0|nr:MULTISPECIES: DUF4376 domain-containing protein [Acinetobacter]MDA3493228.1 DUF4376 domain-containing protein [Acinetobacter sp. AOR33_HL]RZH22452.1 DUF4376 domain-containing protein [Acinetobacter pittii]
MTVLVSKYGEVIGHIFGNDEMIKLNTPEGCTAIDDPPHPNMFFQNGEWVNIPAKPSPYHFFDYEIKKWVDNRSLEEVKRHKWELIKQQRDLYEFGGFEFENNLFDSDANSQLRIATAALIGVKVEWTLKDNTIVELDPEQLIGLKNALALHISNVHERGRIARSKIELSSTIDEIESITY